MAGNEGLAVALEGLEGDARLVAFDGRELVLWSEVPFAPGAPVRLRVRTVDGADRSLEGRTIGSRRETEGRFRVRLRAVNLRREDRSALTDSLPR